MLGIFSLMCLGTLPDSYFRSKKIAKALQKSFLRLFLWFAVVFFFFLPFSSCVVSLDRLLLLRQVLWELQRPSPNGSMMELYPAPSKRGSPAGRVPTRPCSWEFCFVPLFLTKVWPQTLTEGQEKSLWYPGLAVVTTNVFHLSG